MDIIKLITTPDGPRQVGNIIKNELIIKLDNNRIVDSMFSKEYVGEDNTLLRAESNLKLKINEKKLIKLIDLILTNKHVFSLYNIFSEVECLQIAINEQTLLLPLNNSLCKKLIRLTDFHSFTSMKIENLSKKSASSNKEENQVGSKNYISIDETSKLSISYAELVSLLDIPINFENQNSCENYIDHLEIIYNFLLNAKNLIRHYENTSQYGSLEEYDFPNKYSSDLLRPITNRQMACYNAAIRELEKKRYADVFNEIRDCIDDGIGKYKKYISISECILFEDLIGKALTCFKSEIKIFKSSVPEKQNSIENFEIIDPFTNKSTKHNSIEILAAIEKIEGLEQEVKMAICMELAHNDYNEFLKNKNSDNIESKIGSINGLSEKEVIDKLLNYYNINPLYKTSHLRHKMKKKILKEKYNIEWYTPEELHPGLHID